MTEIKIPFLERFREPMLNGQKTQTARTQWYGHKGDTFPAFGAKFTLTVEPYPASLSAIAADYAIEGCASRDDFFEVWKSIHPRRLLDFSEFFWVHRFRKLDPYESGLTNMGISVSPVLPNSQEQLVGATQ